MRNSDREPVFRFKQFSVRNELTAMKVGTDGVLIGAWGFKTADGTGECRVLDVGCGSGLIALMLAQRFPKWNIVGVDIVKDAVDESSRNFLDSPWGDRLTAIWDDFTTLKMNRPADRFDFIISNPPFFENGEYAPDIARRTARHGGRLNFVSLLKYASEWLDDGGRLALIAPTDDRDRIIGEGEVQCLYPDRMCIVKTVGTKPPKRVMIEFVKGQKGETIAEELLLIHSETGGYTQEYQQLVSDFYLHM